MENKDETKTNTPGAVPNIPESEMKLPEEQFGTTTEPKKESGSFINPLLIVLLVILLGMLGTVIVWGNDLLDLLLPTETNDGEVMIEDSSPEEDTNNLEDETLSAEEIEAMEEDAAKMDAEMQAMDQDLAEIEAEMDAELEE